MKNIKIVGIAALAAVLLVGCGEQSVGETSSSSVESSTSSVETSSSSAESSSSSTVESSVDMGDGSTDDIAVIVTDNQDILKSSSTSDTTDSSSNSDTSTDVSTSEPTSEPTSSSSSSSNTSKPTGDASSSSSNSKPATSSSSSSGNVPYGGYYDANGELHANNKDVPRDADGYPVVSFWAEDGSYKMTKADKEAWDAETDRIANGGGVDLSGGDGSKWGFKF